MPTLTHFVAFEDIFFVPQVLKKKTKKNTQPKKTPTRAEWMVSCLGAFSRNVAVSTVYTNLGDEAVIHAMNETEVGGGYFFFVCGNSVFFFPPPRRRVATLVVPKADDVPSCGNRVLVVIFSLFFFFFFLKKI